MKIAIAFFAVQVFLLAYLLMLWAWDRRMNTKAETHIFEPWEKAVTRCDIEACEAYKVAAHEFLEDYDATLKHLAPAQFLRTWNKDYRPTLTERPKTIQ